MINVASVALFDRAPLPKRRAPKNDADWCNRFTQNYHGEPIDDKPILAKSVIWLAGKSQKCHPPNIKNPNIET